MTARLICLFLFCPSAAMGASLTLSEIISRGLEFSPEVKKAVSKVEESKASLSLRQGYLAPQIDLYGSAKHRNNVTTSAGSDEEYDSGLKLTQALYRGGLISGGVGAARTSVEIERQKLFAARQNTVATLVNAYYELVQSEQALQAADDQLEMLKTYAQIVKRYEQNGRARRMDRLQAEVNLSLTTVEQSRLSRERNLASDALKKLLGVEPGGEALTGQVELKSIRQRPLAKAGFESLENNPDLRASELSRRRVQYENEVDGAVDKPSLNLEATYGYRAAERPDWFNESSSYHTVGLFLTVPLFSGFTSFARRSVHSARLKQEDRTVETLKLNLRQQLQEALMNEQNNWQRLSAAQSAVKLGREALNLANRSFQKGVASNQDVLNAQRTRYDSEKVLIESKFSFLRSQIEVDRLQGIDLIETLAAQKK